MVAQLLAAVGLDLSARAYPVEGGLRDMRQIRLLARLRVHVHASIGWQPESPVGGPTDLRAWDVELVIPNCRIGVDAEARVRDFQAVDRRVMLKQRDSGVDRVILVLPDTRSNRDMLRSLPPAASANYPVPARAVLAALRRGTDPGGNAVLVP